MKGSQQNDHHGRDVGENQVRPDRTHYKRRNYGYSSCGRNRSYRLSEDGSEGQISTSGQIEIPQ